MSKPNAREELVAAADWLGWQDESLSDGIKSAEDAIKLWRHWQANPDLPEMADEDEVSFGGVADTIDIAAIRVAVLGYDPLHS